MTNTTSNQVTLRKESPTREAWRSLRQSIYRVGGCGVVLFVLGTKQDSIMAALNKFSPQADAHSTVAAVMVGTVLIGVGTAYELYRNAKLVAATRACEAYAQGTCLTPQDPS